MPLLIFIACSLLISLSHCAKYQIFYRFLEYEQEFQFDLDSEWTVGHAIQQICEERNVQNSDLIRMRFTGETLSNAESLADAGVGSDVKVQIILITPVQLILSAFADTNLKEYLGLNVDSAVKCNDLQPFVRCDQSGNPIKIEVYSAIRGSLDVSLFPDTIQSINIIGSELTGEIDFLRLPRDLNMLSLQTSNLKADFSLMQKDYWPKHLEHMFCSENQLFYGRLDCSKLPRSLINIRLSRMQQLNEIVFHDLPPHLEQINLNKNNLHGLDLSEALPVSMKVITLQSTKINGEIKLQGIKNCTSLKFWLLKSDSELKAKLRKAALESEIRIKIIYSYSNLLTKILP